MNKGKSTKIQVLIEIASLQPYVRQKEIAARVGVTAQSVSDYVKELIAEGYVQFNKRGQYEVTKPGVELILSWANELKHYIRYVTEDVIGKVTIWTAIADEDMTAGTRVGLAMRDGILHAFESGIEQPAASGTVITDARVGEDVGVQNLDGIIPMDRARVTIVVIPRVQRGGSRRISTYTLRHIVGEQPIAVLGLEALIAVKKASLSPTVIYGVKEAIIEAAFRGVSTTVVAVDEEVPSIVARFISEDIPYNTIDLREV